MMNSERDDEEWSVQLESQVYEITFEKIDPLWPVQNSILLKYIQSYLITSNWAFMYISNFVSFRNLFDVQ